MTQQILARKFRPSTFEDLVGQDILVQSLSNSLKNKKIHQAYLLSGTRGVGKTTTARILAKALSCEKGISPLPCNSCNNCRAINNGTFIDLFEIDAASHTKIDETKEIISKAAYPPNQSKFRIFIIDEVHMLSKHSFNALLKTLEEPPPYIIFILATTNPEKLPDTIISRCLHFNLAPISTKVIIARLAAVFTKDNIKYEQQALELIANAAKGSLRDALSLSEPIIAYGDNNISYETTAMILGALPQENIDKLIVAIAEQNTKLAMDIIANITSTTNDVAMIIDQILNTLHNISIALMVSERKSLLSTEIQSLLQKLNESQVQLWYQIAIKGKQELMHTPSGVQCLEMICLRQIAFKIESTNINKYFEINSTFSKETTVSNKPVTHNKPTVSKLITPITKNNDNNIIATKKTTTTTIKTLQSIKDITARSWPTLIKETSLSGMTKAIADNIEFCQIKEDNIIAIKIMQNKMPLFSDTHKKRIEDAITKYFDFKVSLVAIVGATTATPAQIKQQDITTKKQAIHNDMQQDKNVTTIMSTFKTDIEEVQHAEET
jgi:DNA polymerase III subunit gamma/tau